MLSVIKQRFLKISGVGAQSLNLLSYCLYYTRVAMPYGYHVVVSIEVFVTLAVVKISTLTTRNFYRVRVEQSVSWA
ncbi:hypothetical protein D3C85_1771180 [compost metagenome]